MMTDPRYKAQWAAVKGYFDKYLSKDNLKITYAQTYLAPGTPLNVDGKRYKNQTDDELK